MKEIRPGCYKPGNDKKCGDQDCQLRDRCLQGEGNPPPLKLEDLTSVQISKEGRGTGQGA